VISPSTDAVALGRRHLDDPWSPLGRLMRDLGVSSLGQLSTMIPARPRSGTWPLVYRDLCEWAVLYDLICYERWGSDTLVVRDGLLRSHSRVIDRYRLALAVEDVFPAGQPRYAQVPVELQVKVYDWPEYAWPPDDDRAGREKPKTNMGTMYLVRFGRQSHDPVWTVDLLHFQAAQAQQIFGSLLADAELGFPVPCYPHCLQDADRHAQVADLDLAILQAALEEAVRDQIRADRRHVFDAQRLWPADPAAVRYQ